MGLVIVFADRDKARREIQEKVLDKPCIYVIKKGEEILYVGSTSNCRQRLMKHLIYMNKESSILIKHIVERGLNPERVLLGSVIYVEYCEDEVVCREREKEVISFLKPKFNVRYNKKNLS